MEDRGPAPRARHLPQGPATVRDTRPAATARLKFTHRNLLGSGVTFDVAGDYSLNQQQSLGFSVGAPDVLGDGRFLAMFSADYGLDPQRDFFGLGNNDVGPDPVSTHEERDVAGELTIGWRPFRGRLAVALSAGIRHIDIEHGDRDDDTPFTTDLFPDLPASRRLREPDRAGARLQRARRPHLADARLADHRQGEPHQPRVRE
jgi:hypothetical protein